MTMFEQKTLIQCKSKVKDVTTTLTKRKLPNSHYLIFRFFLLWQDNVFQCLLDQQYRDAGCRNSDLLISYVDNTISSPQMGRLSKTFRIVAAAALQQRLVLLLNNTFFIIIKIQSSYLVVNSVNHCWQLCPLDRSVVVAVLAQALRG